MFGEGKQGHGARELRFRSCRMHGDQHVGYSYMLKHPTVWRLSYKAARVQDSYINPQFLVADGHKIAIFIECLVINQLLLPRVASSYAVFLTSFLCIHRTRSYHQMQPGVSFQTPC